MVKNRSASREVDGSALRPLPGSFHKLNPLTRYIVLPFSARRAECSSRVEWMSAFRDVLDRTKIDIETALSKAGLSKDVVFEDELEIGALILSTTADAANVIRTLPTVEKVVRDGLM